MAGAGANALLGTYMGVRYRGVPGILYHVRFLGASTGEPLTPFAFVSRTPQGDYYEEDYGDAANFEDVLQATDHCTIPNVPANQVHAFDAAPTPQQLAEWTGRCHAIVAGIVPGRLRALGAVPAQAHQVPPQGLANIQAVAQPGQAQAPANILLTVDKSPGVLQWILCEAIGGYNFGTRVDCPLPLVKNKKVVHTFAGLGEVFLKCVSGDGIDELLGAPANWDARLLPQVFNQMGKPERTLVSVASLSREEKVAWSLQGDVRSAPWCLMFLQSEGLGFEGHHERLRQLAGVGGDAWGIGEHFQIMMVAKLAFQIDQIDAVNCAFMESLLRRAQTIEFGWAERIKEKESKGMGASRLSLEEQTMFGGLVRQASTLMICPALIDFVRAEVEKEAKLQKALRIAREERENESGRKLKGKKGDRKEGE
jgi:predicted fused transcriptional regulator/phosphomethylpyrimidine kinase